MIKLKKLLLIILLSVFLNSCDTETVYKKEIYIDKTVSVAEIKLFAETTEHETYEDQKINTFLNAIWVSQFDMHPIYRDGNKQREFADYKEKVDILTDNLIYDGFDTVFLQVRPNGDSMLESDFYPNSKYIAGSYGGEIEYDAISAFFRNRKKQGVVGTRLGQSLQALR